METIYQIGILWVGFIQNLGEWLADPMKVITFLGSGELYLLLIPALYWCVDSGLGIRVGMVFMLNGAFIESLKLAFHNPRPYWYTAQLKAYASEVSFGAPSGHAQLAVGVWGMLAYAIKKWWFWLLAVLMMFLIGISRLFLAVHFPHDVILGWLFGAIVLALTITLWDPIEAWLKQKTTLQQILLAFGFSVLLIALSLPGYLWLNQGWRLPVEWANNAALVNPENNPINPTSLELTMTYAGLFFGLTAGLAWLHRYGGFNASGKGWKRFLRYVLGLLGVLAIRYGLKAIFPGGDSWVGYLMHYLRYVVIGLWVTAGAPLVFFWLKLAERVPVKTAKRSARKK